jgi:hypothetical protein
MAWCSISSYACYSCHSTITFYVLWLNEQHLQYIIIILTSQHQPVHSYIIGESRCSTIYPSPLSWVFTHHVVFKDTIFVTSWYLHWYHNYKLICMINTWVKACNACLHPCCATTLWALYHISSVNHTFRRGKTLVMEDFVKSRFATHPLPHCPLLGQSHQEPSSKSLWFRRYPSTLF